MGLFRNIFFSTSHAFFISKLHTTRKKDTKALCMNLCFQCQEPKMRLSLVVETSHGVLRLHLIWWMTWLHSGFVPFLRSYIFGYFQFLLRISHLSSEFPFIPSSIHSFHVLKTPSNFPIRSWPEVLHIKIRHSYLPIKFPLVTIIYNTRCLP
jgi:hypothetical protein